MDKKLKNIIEKVIDMKYEGAQDMRMNDMSKEESAEYEKLRDEVVTIEDKLEEVLSKEQLDMLIEYSDAVNLLNALNERYMFNRGVKAGLIDLSFIRKELGYEVILLNM